MERGEFWYVAQGEPLLKLSVMPDLEDAREQYSISALRTGETVEIPAGVWHQITAPVGGGVILIYEMQFGECSEDDIERIDDKYGRE